MLKNTRDSNAPPSDIVIARCGSKEDLIGEFILFYLDCGFDHICLIDNGENQIASLIQKHPLKDKIHLLIDPRPLDEKRMSEYYDYFGKLATRWIFSVKTDEFIWIPNGIKNYAVEIPVSTSVIRLNTTEILFEAYGSGISHPMLTIRHRVKQNSNFKYAWNRAKIKNSEDIKKTVSKKLLDNNDFPELLIRNYSTRIYQRLQAKLHKQSKQSTMPAELIPPDDSFAEPKDFVKNAGNDESENFSFVEDKYIRDWYVNRFTTLFDESFSPVIKMDFDSTTYYCFSVKSYLLVEGHTSDEHLVLIHAPQLKHFTNVRNALIELRDIPVRIHSECLFGDVFSSDHCDCNYQLSMAMKQIQECGQGIIIYLRQEGRGIGLYHKIRSLTVLHKDSFYRNEAVGLPGDNRAYNLAAQILRYLGVQSVRLISGNPNKLNSLTSEGINCSLTPSALPVNIPSPAINEIQSKIIRGYQYSAGVEEGEGI